MRIFTFYFRALLFIGAAVVAIPLFGNNVSSLSPVDTDNDLEVAVLPDTTCGLMDTLIQLSLPSCPGAADASATIQFAGSPDSLTIEWDNGMMGDTVMGLEAGLHFVTVTDNNSCMLIDSISIVDKAPLDYTINVTNALCIGVGNGAIDIIDTANLSYRWNTGDSISMLSGLGRGLYEVTITDTSGCSVAESIVVEVDTQATLQLSGISATCLGINDGAAIANDSLDLMGYDYLWSTGDTTNSLTNIAAGTYFILVTDPDGCLAADSINILTERSIPIEATINNTSCNEVNDGSISINDTLDVSGLRFGWSTGDSTQTISNLAAGTYSVAVADTLGCLAGGTFEVIADTIGLQVNLTALDATCQGVNDGAISVNDTASVDGFTFDWSNGDSTQTIIGLSAGTYTVTVTDDKGCIAVDSATIDFRRSIDPIFIVTDVSCVGLMDGSIDAIADSTSIFVWNTGDSTSNLTDIGVGFYEITVTDTLGCTATASAEVVANSSLIVNLAANNVSCTGLNDGSVRLTDSLASSVNITWSTGDSTAVVENLATGNYTVTVTDTLGCIAIDSIQIEADSSLQISLTGNNINCSDVNDGRVSASIVGSDNAEDLIFVWNTGDSTATINNLAAGEYTVTVTDTTGCMGVGGVTLVPADSIELVLVASELACMDSTATGSIMAVASGGSGNFTYSWSTGDSTDTVMDLMAGTYVVTATDSLGCTVTDSATLVAPPDLIISTSQEQVPTCEGTADGSISVVASGGTAPFNITWSTGDSTATVENLNPGLYTVTVADDAGCMVTDSINIVGTTNISLTLTEISGASSENTADAVATVSASGGLAPYTFNWDNGAVGDTVNNLSPGIHQVVATDANGCTATDSIDISFFELSVSIIETRNLRCNGDRTGRATAAPNEGTAPFRYVWSTGDTTPILTNLPAGTHMVTVTDAEGQRGTASVTLTQPAPIRFNLEIILPGCPNSADGRITINATGTVGNPLYDFGVGVSTDPFILGVTVGPKRYSIFDGNGCRADTSFTIESISANPPTPAFEVETLGLNATFTDNTTNEPLSYLWKFGDGTTSTETDPVHQYPDTGSYEVCLIVSNACDTDSTCQMVNIVPIPIPGVEINFGRDTASLPGQMVSIPVTVGAFDGVAGISGTFELTNPMVAAIQAVRDFNIPGLTAANVAIQQNLISVSWNVADTSQLVSLPSGTQIFVIDVLLRDVSEACTEIVGTNSESTLQFTKTFMGELVPAPFVINSGEICVGKTVAITGNISREENTNIAGVIVTTNGEVTATTMADGNYALAGLPGGATFTINPSKSDELLAGVTTFDLVSILQHILTQNPLDSPYRIIAADIDNSGTVSSLDLVQLQRLILEKIDNFPNNQPWRFVPSNYTFANPRNPLVENFPERITVNRLEVDTANIDF
ncbi:MAG: PKD domain-containing protein, partial [Bacteroidota bacterium]